MGRLGGFVQVSNPLFYVFFSILFAGLNFNLNSLCFAGLNLELYWGLICLKRIYNF
jgi:hypothetical protein